MGMLFLYLNALNTLYKGAVAAKDEAFANRIENLMDVATVAIMLYENAENGFGDVEKGISCLRVMYDEGAFNQPVGTTNDQRSQVMNIILGAVIQQSPSVTANEDDIDYEVFYVGRFVTVPLPTYVDVDSIFENLNESYAEDCFEYDDFLFDDVEEIGPPTHKSDLGSE